MFDEPRRRRGKITYVTYGKEDHGILTCTIGIAMVGFHQSFGGLALDEKTGPAFKQALCDLFGVPELGAINGLECWALWSKGDYNEPIEGIETLTGERFTLTGFRRKYWPDKTQSRRREMREQLLESIRFAKQRVEAAIDALARFDADDVVDWETAPKGHLISSANRAAKEWDERSRQERSD